MLSLRSVQAEIPYQYECIIVAAIGPQNIDSL